MGNMFDFKIHGVADVLRALDNFERVVMQELTLGMQKACMIVETSAKHNVTNNGTTNLGQLVNSIWWEVGLLTGGIIGGWVLVGAKYGGYVEFGTRPHMPPVEPLKQWAKRKLGDEKLGYPVALKIKKEGTKPQPYLYPAMEQNRDKLVALLGEAVIIAVNRCRVA